MALTKVSTGVVDMSGSTGALEIAKGATTAVAAPLGTLRANTTTNKMEVYASAGWRILKEGGNAIIPLTVDYLLVAGGGGGGGSAWTTGGASGGGGGAGEYLYTQAVSLSAGTTYSVTVGDGGVASGYGAAAGQGLDSVFNAITVNGGGRGGSANGEPTSQSVGGFGGSGGGGATFGSTSFVSGGTSSKTGGGYGTAGGAFTSRNTRWGSGGGGGALTSGSNGTSSTGGDGGNGRSNTITGTNTTYAGGGGGGTFNGGSAYAGSGGTGGGGSASSTTGGNGVNNKGGGGGGGSYGSSSHNGGGAGGSGVVILKYPNSYQINFTAGASPAFGSGNANVGTDTVTTIIAGSGTITFSLKP